MSKISIKFETEMENINNQLFVFEPYLKIRDMLKIFLSKTQSINELSLSQIHFIFSGKIINSPQLLDKYIKNVFKCNLNNKVKVIDSGKIVGGNILFY